MLRPSHHLLLAVVRAQPDRAYPLDDVAALDAADRTELLGLLRRHGIAGWAHRVFTDAGVALPADLVDALRAEHAQNTARSILALAAYERISRLLSGAGIEHIPLKGIRLLETLYADPGTRHLSDIDVLIRERDVEGADGVLREAGWAGEAPAMWERQERFAHHHGYEAPAGFSGRLELHWRVTSSFGRGIPAREPWEGASAAGGGAGSFERRLAPTMELLGLLLHVAQHGYGASLKWLLDLRRFLEAAGGGGDPSTRFARSGLRAGRAVGREAADGGRRSAGGGEEAADGGESAALRASELRRLVERSATWSPSFFALSLVAQICGSSGAAELAGRVRPWAVRARVLDALGSPEWFLERGAVLRRKWPSYALLVALNDRAVDQARVVYGNVAYKLGLEGVRVPPALDRVMGER
ncbi:MAG: nucleotidyltransferase family protein [Deltaproteobacteria bacterium]|nr:nucleotidyltransferase family protein [Deltaproteobacteria bacterium]